MKKQFPDLFQQLDIEIRSRNSCFMDFLTEKLPVFYFNSGKEAPMPYNMVKKYLLKSIDWMWYLLNNPSEYKRCDFSTMDDVELTYLLREKPELHCCIDWQNMLSQEKQQLLLAYHPEWTQNCDDLRTLSGEHWVKLLTLHPEYGFLAPWQKLSGDDWQQLLCERPKFAQYCNFDMLNVRNWEKLLIRQIRFLSFCPTEFRRKFSSEVLEELFSLYPEIQTIWEKTI